MNRPWGQASPGSRRETTQQLQKPWSQDQEGQRGPGYKGAEAPPLGDAFSVHFSDQSQRSPECPGDLVRMKILPQGLPWWRSG